MEIEATPTGYAGVIFRSKLEANWAQFFDLIGIKWEYEPRTVSGWGTPNTGWLPDFLIAGWWLAEVKPTSVQNLAAAHSEPFAKAIRGFDTVLLGDGPGDTLGLVVRRKRDGEIFARHLVADIENGPARLHVFPFLPRGFRSDLTVYWRGLSAQAAGLQALPVRGVIQETTETLKRRGFAA